MDEGGNPEDREDLSKTRSAIGRDPTNDVILNRMSVSRLHCRAISMNGLIFLVDSGSTNGTYVNESRAIGWIPSRKKQERSQAKTPWDVLGISKGTPKAEAKKSYLKLLSLYHPDKVDSLGPKIRGNRSPAQAVSAR
jgi:pSer/pThr/pTyr-binding forkhead associated (FHA) protein